MFYQEIIKYATFGNALKLSRKMRRVRFSKLNHYNSTENEPFKDKSWVYIDNTLLGTLDQVSCEHYVVLNTDDDKKDPYGNISDKMVDHIENGIKWCEKNCHHKFYYSFGTFIKTNKNYVAYSSSGDFYCFFIFEDKEDSFSFQLFYN